MNNPKLPKDGLDEIFKKHDRKYGSAKDWEEALKKDLRDWRFEKKDDAQEYVNELREEWDARFEPKTPFEVIKKRLRRTFN